MNDLWPEVAKQIPALAVLVILVMQFLKHLKEITKGFSDTLKDIGQSCHTHQVELSEEANDTIKKNTLAFDRNTEMYGRVSVLLDRHQQ